MSAGGAGDSLRARLIEDLKAGAAAGLCGCAVAAAVEYPATLWAAESLDVATALRLVLLDVTLFGLLALLAMPAFAAAAAGARLFLAVGRGAERARAWRGLLGPSRLRLSEPGAAAPWLWSLAAGALTYVSASTTLTLFVTPRFKEPQLTALLLACLQLALLLLLGAGCYLLAALLRRIGRRLHPHLGALNPFGSAPAAAALLVIIAAVSVKIAVKILPQMGPLVPWRHLLAGVSFAAGAWGSTWLTAWRGGFWPASRRGRRIALAAALAFAVLVAPLTLLRVGADGGLRSLAASNAAGSLGTLVKLVRKANDFDGDGYGSLLGENDCGPFDAEIHPLATDVPDDGIDQNCDGRDFSLGAVPSYRKGKDMPVPDAYKDDYNFLLVTVDTVRYDHTTMGGYPEETGRNTTPNLAELADRSVSFSFCQAPSAGTMASIPAILTSKFFHSGIALDEDVKRGMPPKLEPENVLISEIVKRKGYTTGAILSHYYFNDWGMEQGFDTYDNEIGAENRPRAVTSDRVTDRALQWIGRHGEDRWFLWVHYIDPHGYYVPHPGEKSYGDSEEDLYDGELHFTDKHLGRLLDELPRLPGGDKTVVVVTSDHGDGFKEHGFVNHGIALYKEILHVPLIVYVPNIQPRVVGGAVSPLDIVPTVADLAGVDVSDLSFEGQSLVPQLFYGQDAHDRVVFAETNIPQPQRAVVTSRYKLIAKLRSNVFELYDLRDDPWEKENLWPGKDEEGFRKMKRYLDDWLARVYYARDPKTNQMMRKLRDKILREPPKPKQRVEGVSFDDGRLEVVGLDTDKQRYRAGQQIKIAVYFRVRRQPEEDFRLQVEAWPSGGEEEDGARRHRAKSRLRFTGNLPTSHWRDGEYIRDRFSVRIPSAWAGEEERELEIGLRMSRGRRRSMLEPTGKTREDAPDLAVLGSVVLEPASPGRIQ